jgi:Na+/melibiose symporter-like transporter
MEDERPGISLVIYFKEVNVYCKHCVLGTICVSLSFPFIFADCLLCHPQDSEWWKVLWFAPFIMIFQFGWAATQISHLALIPELSSDANKRVSMNSYRNAFSVVANLSIFTCLYILLNFNNEEKTISPNDLKYFRVGSNYTVT